MVAKGLKLTLVKCQMRVNIRVGEYKKQLIINSNTAWERDMFRVVYLQLHVVRQFVMPVFFYEIVHIQFSWPVKKYVWLIKFSQVTAN